MPRIEFLARALIEHDGGVLVCRDLVNGHSYLPGGHVEYGEPASAAVARELIEECGLAITVGPPLLAWESRFVQGGKLKHELTLVFHVERSAGEWPRDVPSLEPHVGFEWVEPARLRVERFVPSPVADWLLSGRSGGLDWLEIDERA